MTWREVALVALWVVAAAAGSVWLIKFERPRRIRDRELQDEVLGWPFGEVAARSSFVLAVMAERLHTQMDKYYPVPMLENDLRNYDWTDVSPTWDPISWNAHALRACLTWLEERGLVRFHVDSEGGSDRTLVKITGQGMMEVEALLDSQEEDMPTISIGNLTNSQVVILSENVRQTLRDAQATQSELDPGIPLLIENLLAALRAGQLELPDSHLQEIAAEVQHVANLAESDGMSSQLKRGLRSLSSLVMGAAQSAVRDELIEEFGRILDHGTWFGN